MCSVQTLSLSYLFLGAMIFSNFYKYFVIQNIEILRIKPSLVKM